ncbi:TPA: transporter [Enterobacter hormaechei subsp. steigerwaltii]|nr:transporter [Enterobacter hormaechei subsp. steigerwaltii]HAV1789078.1 transporter [Enterobacter hormaechei subsp. xiangfangensis]
MSNNILTEVKECDTIKNIPFTRYDAGWVIICIGMAIGSGIVFLPLQMGVKGLVASALALLITYPAVYFLTKIYIRTLSQTEKCTDYANIITQYLGKNWGAVLSFIYFFTILKGMLGYATTITHDSSVYLQHFGVSNSSLSNTIWYPFILLTVLVSIASRGERLLFKISGPFIVLKLLIIIILGVVMIPHWNFGNVNSMMPGSLFSLFSDVLVSLPFALFSIVFIQVLNPMNVAFRKIESDPKVATYRALRVSRIAYIILAASVLFFAFSFMFSITEEEARRGIAQNTSALALVADVIPGNLIPVLAMLLSIFAIMSSFLSVYLGFNDALSGIIINLAERFITPGKPFYALLPNIVKCIAILLLWCWVIADISTMSFLQWTIGTFGLVSCLIPAYLVYHVPSLHPYRSLNVLYVALIGFMLVISPLFKLLGH